MMWSIVIAGVAPMMVYLPDMRLLPPSIPGFAILAAVFAHWAYFFVNAILTNPAAPGSVEGVRTLVTIGVYAMVRHPIYSSDIFLVWATFAAFPLLKVLCSAAWVTIVLLVWMRLEETALLRKFGDDYAAYKARTPMIFPNYFKG